ncbi:MAG: sulfatase [Planctomycetia bacterium]|nr:sulfatase [Planctomycetia bacterium]
MSADFGCYGATLIATPHVDRLAAAGTRFRHAFVTAPVCSPCRSALITGMYQTTIGAHHHRSGRGVLAIDLPAAVRPLPAILREAGYWTCIGEGLGGENPGAKRLGKTDYNFRWDPSIYDGADWAGRAAGQPFFMQVTLPGGKLRGQGGESTTRLMARAKERFGAAVEPAAVTLPPYYPRDPVLLADWAAYLDAVRFTDDHVGQVLARLEREGLAADTVVVFMTDHGISHARGKQFLYDEGTHVPLVVRGPGIPRGVVRDDLVEHIDLAALSLAVAGLPVPAWMQGRDLFAVGYQPRAAVFAARDRCDETLDRIRSVRTPTHLYIRNFFPRRPALQPNAYKDDKAIVQRLRALHAAGGIDPLAERLLFAPERPMEELYAWPTDRFQLENLAADPAHAAVLAEMRTRLADWQAATTDPGPEPEAMVDSDMAVYLEESRGAKRPEVERNIALMKEWAAAGR